MVLGLGIHSDGDGEKEGGGEEFYPLNWFYFISGMIKYLLHSTVCFSASLVTAKSSVCAVD